MALEATFLQLRHAKAGAILRARRPGYQCRSAKSRKLEAATRLGAEVPRFDRPRFSRWRVL